MPPIKPKRNSNKKDIIISKAARLFRDKGFAATSMRDLAENVGVEAASLYNHIQSKAEILQEICFRVANLLTTHLEKVKTDTQLNAIGKIEAILKMHIDQMLKNRDEAHVADREWRHLPEPYLSNFKAQRKAYRQWLAYIIHEGIENKEIKPIDPPTAVIIMLHSISCIESWHRSEQKIPEAQLEKNMITILIDGLKCAG